MTFLWDGRFWEQTTVELSEDGRFVYASEASCSGLSLSPQVFAEAKILTVY